MKTSLSHVLLSTVALADFVHALALPTIGKRIIPEVFSTPKCIFGPREAEYRNIVEEEYDGADELVSGASCTPVIDGSCSISKTYSWSKLTTWTVGGGITASFQLSTLFGLSGGPSASYSWTISKGESTSTSVTCPAGGGVTCGMRAIPHMVKITGQWLNAIPYDETKGSCDDQGWQDFEVNSVVIKKERSASDSGPDTQAEDGADVNYKPCLANCDGLSSCKTAVRGGLELCPATDEPPTLQQAKDEVQRDAVAMIAGAITDGANQRRGS